VPPLDGAGAGAGGAGAAAAAGDAAGDWEPASLGAGPVSGWVTFHLIGGTGTDPDRRRRAPPVIPGEV
jgi:hypothetical protein